MVFWVRKPRRIEFKMNYILNIFVITGIYIILCLSLDLILGYAGLPALGHISFAAVGAYTSSLLAFRFGLSPWLGLIVGAMLSLLLGAVISLSSTRLKGDYLAITTFGLGLIIYEIANNWVSLTRGPMGLPGIPGFSIFSYQIIHIWQYLVVVITFVSITYIILSKIVHSPFGKVIQAIREDETATKSLGKDTDKDKIIVFMIGAFFAAIAGSLYAHYITFIDPSSFTPMESITVLLMVVFGGMGTLTGSFVGASTLIIFPEMLRFVGLPDSIAAPIRQMIYGLLLILLMLKRPQGIFGKYHWR